MAFDQGFNPAFGSGTVNSVSAVSATASVNSGCQTLCLTNLGSEPCYVNVGDSSEGVTATTADYCVPGYAQVVIRKFQDYDQIAFVTAANTSSLHVIAGNGV